MYEKLAGTQFTKKTLPVFHEVCLCYILFSLQGQKLFSFGPIQSLWYAKPSGMQPIGTIKKDSCHKKYSKIAIDGIPSF